MSEKIKLSKDELEQLQGFRRQNNEITFQLGNIDIQKAILEGCLLYTSPSPRDRQKSRMPSSA